MQGQKQMKKEIIDCSVIIPVYNSDPVLLKKCIESIRTNKTITYEILLIDDGSQPAYEAEYRKLCVKKDQVRYIRCEHAGVSRARNTGLYISRGTYVTFVDSDDRMASGGLDLAVGLLKKSGLNLLIGQITRNERLLQSQPVTMKKTALKASLKGISRLRIYYMTFQDSLFRQKDKWINRAPHGRVLSRELALECPFQEELSFGEDVIWNFDLLDRSGEIMLLICPLYYYRINAGSATRTLRPDFPDELKLFFGILGQRHLNWSSREISYEASLVMELLSNCIRLHVMRGNLFSDIIRFRELLNQPYWKNKIRTLKLSGLVRKRLLIGILLKLHCYELVLALHGLFL